MRVEISKNRGILFFVMLMMISLVGTGYSATTGPNIFQAGGFELEPLKWTLTDDAVIDDNVAYQGQKSLRIRGKGTAHNASYHLAVPPGISMMLKVWIKTEGFSGYTPKISVGFKDINKGYTLGDKTAYTEIVPKYGTNEWEEYEEIVQIPEEAYYIYMTIAGKGGAGTLWFDECSVQLVGTDPVPPNPPNNLIGGRVNEFNSYLRWEEPGAASDGEKPICYRVYRSISTSNLVSPNNLIGEVYSTSYLDQDMLSPIQYCYAVTSVDLLGNEAASEIIIVSDKSPNKLAGNYGFEDINDKKWTLYQGSGTVEYDDTVSFDGNYSIKMEQKVVSTDNSQLHHGKEPIVVKEDTDYVATVWVKGDNILVDGTKGGLNFFIQTGQPNAPTVFVDGTFDWTLLHLYFNSGSAKSVIPRILFSSGTGTAWIDNYYLAELNEGLSPNSPEILNAERINGTKKVTIEWSPPKDVSGVEVIGYKLLRSSDPDFSTDTTIEYSVGLKTEFTDDDVDPYSVFYYKVIAVSGTGSESIPSEVASISTMGKVEGTVIAYDSNGEIIYISEASLQITDLNIENVFSDEDGKFTIEMLLEGNYKLEIRKASYKKEPSSFEIVGGETTILDPITLKKDDVKPNQVTYLSVDANSHIGALLISWEPPDPEGDGDEAVAYNIYKSTDPDFEVNENTKAFANIKGTLFIDNKVVFEKTYYYVVKALDAADNESELASPTKGGKVEVPPIPKIIEPESGKIFTDEALLFQWERETVDGYILEICSVEDFSKNVVELPRIPGEDSSFSTKEFPVGVSYWRLRVSYDYEVVGPATKPRKIIYTKTNTGLDTLLYVQIVPKVFDPQNDHTAKIYFVLDEEATVSVKTYNVAGKVLDVIALNEHFPAGEHYVEWNGTNNRGEHYKNGLYLIEILIKNLSDKKTNRYVGRVVINK